MIIIPRKKNNVVNLDGVAEKITKDGCYIYLAFNTPDSIEQDYFEVTESYQTIINKISDAVILNAYAQVQNF